MKGFTGCVGGNTPGLPRTVPVVMHVTTRSLGLTGTTIRGGWDSCRLTAVVFQYEKFNAGAVSGLALPSIHTIQCCNRAALREGDRTHLNPKP
jgi:hypothetical protein